jgi:hypothetical protein
MSSIGLHKSNTCMTPISATVVNDKLIVGDLEISRRIPKMSEKVPNPLFYENQSQTIVLRNLLRTFTADKSHAALVIGNQGVGKNKLVDRMLHLLNCEREYIQLHRDTTIQSLTVMPTLQHGRIVYEDSPLIKAAREGRVLVVDEADKAPLEVLCLLKMLVEDGELVLNDGRRLLSQRRVNLEHNKEVSLHSHDVNYTACESDVIPIHPDFRLIVLANRPGYPFHGNNLYREIGDVFSIHVVDNLDLHSEISLLRSYAPNVGEDVIRRIAIVFRDLRLLYDKQELQYPYSAREAVAVAKHMEHFPHDGVVGAVENIISFDAFSPRMRMQVASVFQSHGIPIPLVRIENVSQFGPAAYGIDTSRVTLAKPVKIPDAVSCTIRGDKKSSLNCSVVHNQMNEHKWQSTSVTTSPFRMESTRLFSFG